MTKKYEPADLTALKQAISDVIGAWNNMLPDNVTGPAFMPLSITLTPGIESVKVGWTPNPALTLVRVTDGRNGTDKNGTGPWSATEPNGLVGGNSYRVFDNLVAGTAYTFTVNATYSDGSHETATSAATPTAPVITPPAAQVGWASGVWSRNDPTLPPRFGTARGQAVKVIGVFPERNNGWAGLANNWWANDPQAGIPAGFIAGGGNVSVGIPLWPESGSGGLGSATTAQWTAIAKSIKDVDPNAHIRLAHEMNLPNSWSVNPGNRTAWVAEWLRAADIFLSVSPTFRICWNPNAGADQTGVDSRSVFQQVKAKVYSYGLDDYDWWPPATTQAGINTQLTVARYLGESYEYAIAQGKKFALPEWGVVSGTAVGGSNQGNDNPAYINMVMNYLKSKPLANIAFDCYFSETQDYLKSDLFEGRNPNASAAYRAQFI